MRRDGDIVSMLRKHAAKKFASSVMEEQNQEEEQEEEEEREIQEDVGPTPTPTPSSPALEPIEEDVLPPPPSGYDVDLLPHDLGERLSIASYHINDQDVRRAYILRGGIPTLCT